MIASTLVNRFSYTHYSNKYRWWSSNTINKIRKLIILCSKMCLFRWRKKKKLNDLQQDAVHTRTCLRHFHIIHTFGFGSLLNDDFIFIWNKIFRINKIVYAQMYNVHEHKIESIPMRMNIGCDERYLHQYHDCPPLDLRVSALLTSCNSSSLEFMWSGFNNHRYRCTTRLLNH